MRNFITFFLILFLAGKIFANQEVQPILKNLFDDNASHVKKNLDSELAKIQQGQTPGITVVSCSDSRVQSSTLDNTPINNLFSIRNIGNQIATATGSVKYGVRYVKTPVLLIIGHVDCGAVKAAVGGYTPKSKALHKELETLQFPNNTTEKDGVVVNVHNQVKSALELFSKEVKEDKLVIIGTVYDFKNEYGKGFNRLIVVNLNGEQDPKVISKSDHLKGITDVQVGVQ